MIIFDEESKKSLVEFGEGDISIFRGLSDNSDIGFIYLLDGLGTQPVGTVVLAQDLGISAENVVEKSNVIMRFNNKESLKVFIDSLINLYSDMNDNLISVSNSQTIIGEE